MLTTKKVNLSCLEWADEREEALRELAQGELEDDGFLLPPNSQLGLVPRRGPNKYESDLDPTIKFKHGTTTLAFRFAGGVIVAVDSRSTMGPYIGTVDIYILII